MRNVSLYFIRLCLIIFEYMTRISIKNETEITITTSEGGFEKFKTEQRFSGRKLFNIKL